MIPKDKGLAFLESKKTKALTEKDFKKFSKPYRYLGLVICSLYKNKDKNNLWEPIKVKTFHEHFGTDHSFNPWEAKEGQELARLLFGKYQCIYISKIWDFYNGLPYQEGYARRSFRLPPTALQLHNKLGFLRQLYNVDRKGFSGMPILEMVTYDVYYTSKATGFIYAMALMDKKNGAAVFEKMKDILQGEDEIGGVTQGIIRALLLTDKPEAWKLVGDLLLAAQREEGLRQTILETLDETSIGALKYLMEIILENDLMRFSSVVRAVDTWFGFAWEAPKKATIKRVLNLSIAMMDDKDLIPSALKSKDNLEVYVALWVIGLENADKAALEAIKILKTGSKEKQILACMFMSEAQRTDDSIMEWVEAHLGEDMELDYWVLQVIPKKFKLDNNLFTRIRTIAEQVPKKGEKVEGQVFSWAAYTVSPDFFYNFLIEHSSEKQIVSLAENISLIPSDSRYQFIRKIFPLHSTWSYHPNNLERMPKLKSALSPWKRAVMFQALADRNESVQATGLALCNFTKLGKDGLEVLIKLLSRKGEGLRAHLIKIIIKQEEKEIKGVVDELVAATNVNQRLAALEIMSQIAEDEKYHAFINNHIERYSERKKIGKNEEVLLQRFVKKESKEFSFANGFGDLDHQNLRPLMVPELKFGTAKKSLINKIKNKITGKNKFLFSDFIDASKIVKEINKLIDLIKENKDYEYQCESWDGSMQTYLLGNRIELLIRTNQEKIKAKDYINHLPLHELWLGWYKASKLNDFELIFALKYGGKSAKNNTNFKDLILFLEHYIPDLNDIKYEKKNEWYPQTFGVPTILEHLIDHVVDFKTITYFKVDHLEDLLARTPESIEQKSILKGEYNRETPWGRAVLASSLIDNSFGKDLMDYGDEVLQLRYWDLCTLVMASTVKIKNNKSFTIQEISKIKPIDAHQDFAPSWLTNSLYNAKLISEDDFKFQALVSTNLFRTLEGGNHYGNNLLNKETLPTTIMNSMKNNMLALELERGDLETEASSYMSDIAKIEGCDYLLTLLDRLGKETLSRGYYWSGNATKKLIFSSLIKKSFPNEDDSLSYFLAEAKKSKVAKKRWMEVAVYAPQWANWIGELLKIEDLEDAVWWFHAHASDYMNAEKETIVSRYSNIEKSDFEKGAIDIEWFENVYGNVGKQNWKILNDAAKYISDGNGHRLVKLYSNVLLGEVKVRETLAKINTKRDKDYVKAFGLIPLSKANRKKDLLSRYNLLQSFLKESKQFGAQRQESEKNAVNIALDNLSRNAGYSDSIRFSWSMEAQATQKIMEGAKIELDNVVLQLYIDDQGKADISIEKDGKKQKSIPAKYKKDKGVLALKKNKTFLRRQYSRTRLSLEKAMLNEEAFTGDEITTILKHPIVFPMLSNLVWYNKAKKIAGFWKEGTIQTLANKKIKLNEKDTWVIAHPAHLYECVEWELYQKYAFDNKLVQPFKQIFRELYLITENEKETGNKSQRYQGHQIQPQKTVALLRSRGWTVSHEEGLQKVYHKKNFIATMYAMADWFSPADIEAPTLEYVCFHSRKDYKLIPLKDIDPVTFSEVMRDIDLVVSVAHVGAVDPEASHSTMEMRAVLAKESARLFKAENVTVKKRYIIIKGKLADYSIHLGSGMVTKNGLQMSVIPVHSQHRGRIFLPFVDDDPKSAEIISKMKLFSEDDKIKDPTILRQING